MSEARRAGSRDLVLVAGGALASLFLMALPIGGVATALALVPLVLFLPGYALAAAMFPATTLARTERAAYSFALSVSASALGGLVWQLAFGLDRLTWALILAAVTLAGCAVARRRRAAQAPRQRRPRARLPRLDRPTALAAVIAAALAIAAVRTAIDGLQQQRAESNFSSLWVMPREDGSGAIEVGVSNHQSAVHYYRLHVGAARRTLQTWEGRLGSRAQEQLILDPAIPPEAKIVVSLFRDGRLYRRVELQAGVGA